MVSPEQTPANGAVHDGTTQPVLDESQGLISALGGQVMHPLEFKGSEITPTQSGSGILLDEPNESNPSFGTTSWISHPSNLGYLRPSPGSSSIGGSLGGSSGGGTSGSAGISPSQDSGTSNGSSQDEVKRLANFNGGAAMNPTSTQGTTSSRAQQRAVGGAGDDTPTPPNRIGDPYDMMSGDGAWGNRPWGAGINPYAGHGTYNPFAGWGSSSSATQPESGASGGGFSTQGGYGGSVAGASGVGSGYLPLGLDGLRASGPPRPRPVPPSDGLDGLRASGPQEGPPRYGPVTPLPPAGYGTPPSVASAAALGLAQGAANVGNSVTDVGVGLANLLPFAYNWTVGWVPGVRPVGYFEWEWSQGLVTSHGAPIEDPQTHRNSRIAGNVFVAAATAPLGPKIPLGKISLRIPGPKPQLATSAGAVNLAGAGELSLRLGAAPVGVVGSLGTISQMAVANPGGGGGGAAPSNVGGKKLVRYGSPDTAAKLAADAAAAEAKLGHHGVSAMLRNPPKFPHGQADFGEAAKVFQIIKTGDNPSHYTVILPKPVTQEVADLFNSIFQLAG